LAGECRDRRQGDIGQGKYVPWLPDLSLEANLIGDISCNIVLVIVDVDLVKHIVGEIKIVGT
jgi:hypothetical protein